MVAPLPASKRISGSAARLHSHLAGGGFMNIDFFNRL
jgi:hypothetical protein